MFDVTMRVLDRAQSRIPQPWRTIIDWFVTTAVAVAFVLAFQAEVAKPYRIPSPSMEPTLHCAKPVEYCEGRFSDRVIANRLAYRLRDPERGDIVVFKAPATADRCGLSDGGSAFVKRIIGLPGEVVSEREGVIYINGDRLIEPYVAPSRRGHENGKLAARRTEPLFRTRGQSRSFLRLSNVGHGTPQRPDRPGDAHLLAAQALVLPLAGRSIEPGMEAAGIEPAF